MPTFKVRRTVDAYVIETAEIEASDAAEAARLARETEGRLSWRNQSVRTFDARRFGTLRPNGSEIEETAVGEF